eukprot:g5866.t1
MKITAWSSFLCVLCLLFLVAITEGFVVVPAGGVATARYSDGNTQNCEDAASKSVTCTVAAAATASMSRGRGGRNASPSRLFAKATYKNFEDMLEKEPGAILVDFYATWCEPCNMMAKTLAVVGPNMKDELKIFKIDSDKYPKLMTKFNVTGLPTLILFKEGKELQRIEGGLPAEPLMQRLRYFLAGAATTSAEPSSGGSGAPGGDACAPPPQQDACKPPPRDACAPPPQE